jgi:hypothetical protein
MKQAVEHAKPNVEDWHGKLQYPFRCIKIVALEWGING